jgi:hypothetical protein
MFTFYVADKPEMTGRRRPPPPKRLPARSYFADFSGRTPDFAVFSMGATRSYVTVDELTIRRRSVL